MKKALFIVLLLQVSVLLAESGDQEQQDYTCNFVSSQSVDCVVQKGTDFSFLGDRLSGKGNRASLKNASQIENSELIAQEDSVVHEPKFEAMNPAIAHLNVETNDGSTISHELKNISKVYFENGRMHLIFLDSSEGETLEISRIGKLFFGDYQYPVDTLSGDSLSVLVAKETIALNVFPNPFERIINISNNGNEEILAVEVFDLAGRLIIEEDALNINGNHESIDLNRLESGSYILKIHLANKILTRKIIKK